MAKRGAVSARQRAREARAALDAERIAREKLVDERVVGYLEAVDTVSDAVAALEEAQERLRLAEAECVGALGRVLVVEKDAAVVRALTGATQAQVTEARKARKAAETAEAQVTPVRSAPAAEVEADVVAVEVDARAKGSAA